MARQLLQRVALFARRRYLYIFGVFALAILVSLLLAARLRFDADVLNLLPQNEPVVQIFRQSLEEFGSLDLLLVVVRIPEGTIVDPYETFVDRLGARLQQLELLERVEFRIGDFEELVSTFLPRSMYFLDASGRRAVAERLSDRGLIDRARELRQLVATPQSLALKPLIKLDPLGLSEIFLGRLESTRAGLEVDWSSGYLLSRDQRMLLILAAPVEPPQNIEFDRQLVAVVGAEIATLIEEWQEIAGPDPPPAPAVELGGRYLIALSDESLIRGDVVVNGLTSMVGVLLLFLFAFRRLGPLLYAFVPLFCGLALTFGFSSLAFGVLSSATSGVAALLIGLGIDFVIVSYGRFVEERQQGRGLLDALTTMSGSSGRAVVVGAITSAATFYSFAITDFAGLRQMGYLTGTGILLCMGAVLLLLPAMLSWSEDHHQRRETRPRLFLHGFGTARLIRWCMARPWPVLVGGAVISATAVVLAFGITFDDSVQSMRPSRTRGVLLRDEVSERFGSGFDHMMLVVTADSLDRVLELADRAAAGAERLIESGELTGLDAVSTVIPPPRQQAEALAWLRRERAHALNMERIRATFRRALIDEGLRPESFAAGLDLLAQAVAPSSSLDVEALRAGDPGERLLGRYLRQTEDGWKSVVYLYPPPRVWRRRPPPGAVRLAEELGPDAVLVGANVLGTVLRRRVLADALIASAVGAVVVGFLLWLDYRSLGATLLSMAPLVVGISWMLGAMTVLGIPMNFMNVFVTTMIIGIGVDYGVHMIHRFREVGTRKPERLQAGLEETGKAIVMAALSTVVGFGSLSLSHYPGLRSMGMTAILGAVSTSLVAITLLPAYLALRARRSAAAEDRG